MSRREAVTRSGMASTAVIDDEVTVSLADPGSPGQRLDDPDAPTIRFSAEVDVPSGRCADVVALEVWQLGPAPDDPRGLEVQADYLGAALVEQPCP